MIQSPHITPKQLKALRQVQNFQQNRCYSATIGELAQSLSISRTTAYEHIASLREKRLLAKSTGKARCLKLTAAGERLLEQAGQYPEDPVYESEPDYGDQQSRGSIMLRGRVCAGYGVDAIEEHTPIDLPDHFGHSDDLFALQVTGQSMIDAGIHDGDTVICRQASAADNGQIVIALLEDEQATIKRFYRDPKAARLMPANDAFEPIYSDTCRIQAVVVGLIRRF